MDNILENAIIYLIRKDRFYAEMLHRMHKNFNTDIETMGVWVDTKGVHIEINPHFLNHLSVPEQAEVLKHECEHPMRGHFEREKTLAPDLYKDQKEMSILDRYKNQTTAYFLNLAEDYAINETLPYLPKKFKVFGKDGVAQKDPETDKDIEASPALVSDLVAMFPDEKIERNQAMEYYYSFIKQKAGEGKFKGKNQNGLMVIPVDKHDMFDKSMAEIDSEFAKEIIQKLANEAKEATPGKIPGHLEVLIDNLNKSVHNWKRDLRMFHTSCITTDIKFTRRRRNRRYGLLYPGKKHTAETHLAIIIDSSASVNDRQLAQFHPEIKAIDKTGAKITVIECDCQVNNVYAFDPNAPFKVKGRGGTAFRPAFDLVQSKEFIKEYGAINGLIYLTDGGNYDNPDIVQPPFKVLWALLPHCSVKYDWGRCTWIEVTA